MHSALNLANCTDTIINEDEVGPIDQRWRSFYANPGYSWTRHCTHKKFSKSKTALAAVYSRSFYT